MRCTAYRCDHPGTHRVQGFWHCFEHAKKAATMAATPYAVHCPIHGFVWLTREEYAHQMDLPDDGWRCPVMDTDPQRFGLCGAPALWDEENFESFCLDEAEGA